MDIEASPRGEQDRDDALTGAGAHSRRNILAGVGAVAGAIAGGGIAGFRAADASRGAPAPAGVPAARTLERSSLTARDLRGLGQRRGPRRDQPGDQIVSRATLVDAEGQEIGSFYSTAVVVSSPKGQTAAATLENHRFELRDGVIVGNGLAGRMGEPAEFAVIGGTGRYLAARGSYAAVQRPYHLGGDGTASFVFSLLSEE
jgi:hypothetical protein